MVKENIYSNLNAEQYSAATSDLGSILVLAGAGTGKTSTIVARVANLVTDKNVEPKDIILLTFTTKAAGEMKERLKRYIQEDVVDKMSISTFHALCLGVVKKYYPDKKLISESDEKILFDTTYSKIVKIKPDGFYAASTLLSYFNNYINSQSNSEYIDWMRSQYGDIADDEKEIVEYNLEQYQLLYDAYMEVKEKYNVATFSDLIVLARTYLLENENSIKEVIVDEFQDTNPLQNSMLSSISSDSIFCVGDYDQSIYAFNGADLNIIKDFQKREKFILHNLKKNYRSKKPILDVAEKVIKNNLRIYPKSLEVMVDSTDSKEPELFVYKDPGEQYDEISKKCYELIKQKKDSETVAVLYRSNSSGNNIEIFLREYDIDISRNMKNTFLEHIEIKKIFSIMKLIIYKNIDFLEFLGLFSGIVNKNSKETAETYYNMITHRGALNLYDGLKKDKAKNISQNNSFFHNSKESILSLLDLLDFNQYTKASSVISTIIKSKYFVNTLNNIAFEKSDDDAKKHKYFSACMSRAESLIKISRKYRELQNFYKDITKTFSDDEQIKPNTIQLMTVHSSKGLEFDYVFVVDMDDDIFPNKRLMTSGNDDEERRLFYVACTRAKQELYFSFAKFDHREKSKKVSRFIKEAELMSAT